MALSRTARSLAQSLARAGAAGRDTASARAAAGPPSSSSGTSATTPSFGPPPGSAAARLFEAAESLPPPSAGSAAAGAAESAEAAAAAAAAAAAPHAHPPGPAAAAARFLFRTAALAAAGAGAAAAYYTAAYTVDQVEARAAELDRPGAPPLASAAGRALQFYAQKRKDAAAAVAKYADPPSDRLLPDLPPGARHVRTLVLDLDDVLIHSTWSRGTGWRVLKRPGVDDFLKGAAQYYEIVLYTSQLPTYADPILDRLDPHRCIQYRLYRDSTQYVGGVHARDLGKLNRDPARVLFVTAEGVRKVGADGGPAGGGGGQGDEQGDAPPGVKFGTLQPENAVHVRPWSPASPSDPSASTDTSLLDLLPFLEAIFRADVPDTRAVVRAYEGCEDVGSAFRARMKAKSGGSGGGGGGGSEAKGGGGGRGFRLFGR